MSVGIKTIGSEKVTIDGKKVKERLNLKKSTQIISEDKTSYFSKCGIGINIMQINDDAFITLISGMTSYHSYYRWRFMKYDKEKMYLKIYDTSRDARSGAYAQGYKNNKFYEMGYNGNHENHIIFEYTISENNLEPIQTRINNEDLIDKTYAPLICCTTPEQNEFYYISDSTNTNYLKLRLFKKKEQTVTDIVMFTKPFPNGYLNYMHKYKNKIYFNMYENEKTLDTYVFEFDLEKKEMTRLFGLKEKFNKTDARTSSVYSTHILSNGDMCMIGHFSDLQGNYTPVKIIWNIEKDTTRIEDIKLTRDSNLKLERFEQGFITDDISIYISKKNYEDSYIYTALETTYYIKQ